MTDLKPKIAVYMRVSQRELHLENQRDSLERRVAAEDWDVTWFEETESTRNTRPVKEEILRKLRTRELTGVLVYSIDRWSRSVKEFALELDEFKRRGVEFYSIREAFSPDTAMGTAMMLCASVFAQLERDLIRERTLAGLDRARRQGKHLGRPKGSVGVKKRKIATVVVREYLANRDVVDKDAVDVNEVKDLIDEKLEGV